MNYTHLRAFWAVAHEGSLTQAAGRLNVAQSALSTQIQSLEERMGQALFERRGRGLHLTEAGRIALDHADVIFATAEELTATLANRSGPKQILRVGALATLSRNFQIQFLAPVLGQPDVEVVLRSGSLAELLAGLEAHRFDVVLLNTAPSRDAATPWVVHPIAAQSVSLVGTATRIGEGHDLASLLEHPLVLPSIESGIRIGFDRLIDQHGLRPNIVAEADDMAMLRLLARQDIGIALVPPIVVQDELQSGELIEALALATVQEAFSAVTLSRRFPNVLLKHVLPGGDA